MVKDSAETDKVKGKLRMPNAYRLLVAYYEGATKTKDGASALNISDASCHLLVDALAHYDLLNIKKVGRERQILITEKGEVTAEAVKILLYVTEQETGGKQ